MDVRACYERLGGDYDDVIRRLRQEERVVKFLRMFPRDENFQVLTRALEEEDWAAAFRAAHSVKGVALTLGLSALADSSSDLTEALRSGRPDRDPRPLYRAMKDDYEKTVAAVEALTGQ